MYRAKASIVVVLSRTIDGSSREGVVKSLFEIWSAATRRITDILFVRGRDAEKGNSL